MDIFNPQTFDRIRESNGFLLKCKSILIGVWRMDNDSSTIVSHGLDVTTIIGCQVMIRNDLDTVHLDLCTPVENVVSQGSYSIQVSDVSLSRVTGGHFDQGAYNHPTFNRGWVFLWYYDM